MTLFILQILNCLILKQTGDILYQIFNYTYDCQKI